MAVTPPVLRLISPEREAFVAFSGHRVDLDFAGRPALIEPNGEAARAHLLRLNQNLGGVAEPTSFQALDTGHAVTAALVDASPAQHPDIRSHDLAAYDRKVCLTRDGGTAGLDPGDWRMNGQLALRLWARSVLKTLTGPVSGALVRAVFSDAGDSPEVRELRHRFWLTRAALVRPLIDQAVRRGQLPVVTDANGVIRHVGAPLYYRLLVLAEPLSGEVADLAAAVATTAAQAGVFVQSSQSTDRKSS